VQEETPQLEDGFTRIANELFEAILGAGFTQRQILVLLTVLRKTYGYGKKEDDMSAAQIGQMCDVKRNHVTEVIGQLVSYNVLTRSPGTFGLVLGINKNYRRWVVPKKDTQSRIGTSSTQPESSESVDQTGSSPNSGLVPNRDESSPNLGQVDSPNLGHTKENLPKETQKKSDTHEPDDTISEVLAYLNDRAGRNFRLVKSNMKFVAARLKSGATLEQCKAVIDAKVKEWKGTSQDVYLRPETLFNETKFEQYLGALEVTAGSSDWWLVAGFAKKWQAENAGCTKSNAHQWRDGKRIGG
jgi:phage replication O-like protein O